MLQLKSIKSSKVKSPSSIEVSLEIRMLRRAAEEVGPKECLPDLLYLNVVVRRALFSDELSLILSLAACPVGMKWMTGDKERMAN